MDPDVNPAHLTTDEIATLNAARDTLNAYSARLVGREYGRFDECATRAEAAIFRVLNVVNSYSDQELAYSVLHNVTLDPVA